MLFNSYEFLLFFLPITIAGFFVLARYRHIYATAWLAAMSVAFYGWWDLHYVPLLLTSIVFNYFVGRGIGNTPIKGRPFWLIVGVTTNLAFLGYFKYFNFFIDTINRFTILDIHIAGIILPLGISFFTFTQIAFLVDTYRGVVKEYRFVHYLLFVTYFPHLIAGPVLHHKEMMPQFAHSRTFTARWNYIAAGMTMFVIGLAKKMLIADRVAEYVAPGFVTGGAPDVIQAWGSALAYTMQLYFDFSGYSDMAIGLSLLFGIRLPLNFNSPYKATSIIEFWRRWHMTLSRFLRDYLYIPLGGNRNGPFARYRNLLITMVLGGLWHGAGWTFVAWGALHGIYLVINHLWSEFTVNAAATSRKSNLGGWTLTFIMVVVAWVFFRAPDLVTALSVVKGMSGLNGILLPMEWLSALPWLGSFSIIQFSGGAHHELFSGSAWIIGALGIALFSRNSQEIMDRFSPALDGPNRGDKSSFSWTPTTAWSVATALVFTACFLKLGHVSEFLYFQF